MTAVNAMTTPDLPLVEQAGLYARCGAKGIGIVRGHVAAYGAETAARLLDDHGLAATSLGIAGGFAREGGAALASRVDDARRAIDEAAALGAPVLTLVVGPAGDGGRNRARGRVQDALASLSPRADAAGVRLAAEPLHPMYAAEASFACTSAEALELVAPFPRVGIVLDTYHLWWEAGFPRSAVAAPERLALVHVSDWREQTRSLCDRALPGDGVIDWAAVCAALADAGYDGTVEVEVLSDELWRLPPERLVRDALAAWRALAEQGADAA